MPKSAPSATKGGVPVAQPTNPKASLVAVKTEPTCGDKKQDPVAHVAVGPPPKAAKSKDALATDDHPPAKQPQIGEAKAPPEAKSPPKKAAQAYHHTHTHTLS